MLNCDIKLSISSFLFVIQLLTYSIKLVLLLVKVSVINLIKSSFFCVMIKAIFSNSLINNFNFVLAFETINFNSSFNSDAIFFISVLNSCDNTVPFDCNLDNSFAINDVIFLSIVSKLVIFLNSSIIIPKSNFNLSNSPLCVVSTKLSIILLK